jgi:hypothetical protein
MVLLSSNYLLRFCNLGHTQGYVTLVGWNLGVWIVSRRHCSISPMMGVVYRPGYVGWFHSYIYYTYMYVKYQYHISVCIGQMR